MNKYCKKLSQTFAEALAKITPRSHSPVEKIAKGLKAFNRAYYSRELPDGRNPYGENLAGLIADRVNRGRDAATYPGKQGGQTQQMLVSLSRLAVSTRDKGELYRLLNEHRESHGTVAWLFTHPERLHEAVRDSKKAFTPLYRLHHRHGNR